MSAKNTAVGILLFSVAAAAGAQTYSPGQLPALSSGSVGIGNTLTGTYTAPTALQTSSGYGYNFVDLYAFTAPTSSAAADTVTLTFNGQPVDPSNVQIAIFANPSGSIDLSQWASDATGLTTASYTPSSAGYSFANLVGTTTGAVSGGGWGLDNTSTINLGGVTDTVVTLSSVSLTSGNYFLEVRGLATTGGSYGGNLTILSVPEPTSPLLLLTALPLLALAARRTRRPS